MIICDKYQNQKFNCVVGPILVHNLVLVETIQDLNQITSLATDKQDYKDYKSLARVTAKKNI